jgi:predicted house-cleaning noncanonical NTP pyrophosphatase (MazG superfamily)
MPRKLIRNLIPKKFGGIEYDREQNLNNLNKLYELKVKEELQEIIDSGCKDITEFADLIQVVEDWARVNNINALDLSDAQHDKAVDKGTFDNTVITNLNPNNPSNSLYFK